MSKELHFTNAHLLKISPPASGRVTYKDAKEKGLILLVGYGGSKVFYLYKKIAGKPCRLKIAPFPDLSVSEARREAAELKSQIARGNISLAMPASKMTFQQLFDRFINDYAKLHKETWQQDAASMARYGKSLYNIHISAIDRQIVQKLFNNIAANNGKVTANRFLSLLSTVFNHAIKWEILTVNPTIGITKHAEQSRDRYLTSEEIPRFFKAIDAEPNEKIRDFILLSLYTGARKSNVLSMNWDNISFEDKTWYIPHTITKNGKSQLIPLIDEAVEILKTRKNESKSNDWVFPSDRSSSGHMVDPSHVWYDVLARAGIADVTLHDLRRTMASWMAQMGASSYIIAKALNHKSPRSTDVYTRLDTNTVRESMSKAISSSLVRR